MFTIEPDGSAAHGPCPDCGEQTRSVWGFVSTASGPRAVYFIRWTDGHLDRGAQVMVSIGRWGEQASAADRVAFGIECRIGPSGPGFMLVDASALPWSDRAFLGAQLDRPAALASPLKAEVFALLDALIVDDPRFRAFLAGRAQSP